jgi:hypothetical protein
MTDKEEASKDLQITSLIGQAERLVTDLNDTVATMKRILTAASADIQGAKDAQDSGQ